MPGKWYSIGFSIVIILISGEWILLIKKFVKTNDLGTKYGYQRAVFLVVLLSSLFLQSMINASVSQPYYFVNFLTVILFVYFVLFTQNNIKFTS